MKKYSKYSWLAAILSLAISCGAYAADYYVRTDGNDANPGTGNNAGGAWQTITKCAAALNPGDRCRVQPGRHFQTTALPRPARSGVLRSASAASDCTCTKGSSNISCTSINAVASGDWVMCNDADPYFKWTRVTAISGTTLTLEEGYRGPTVSGQTLSSAQFVEFLGDGPDDSIVISRLQPKPSGVTWQTVAGYPGLWQYDKAGATGNWANPTSFSAQNPPTQDKWYRNRDGTDTFLKVVPNSCPCANQTSCAGHVSRIRGSWCDDGAKIFMQTWNGASPDTMDVQASNFPDGASVWDFAGTDYAAFRNFYIKAHGPQNGYTAAASTFNAFQGGGNSQLISGLTAEGGWCAFNAGKSTQREQFEHLKCLNRAAVGQSAGTTRSGTRFYDMESRGWFSSLIGADYLKGVSAADRIVFDRIYLHRAMTMHRDKAAGCTNDTYYDCSTASYPDEFVGEHGAYLGNYQAAYAGRIDHLLIQNSIIEITADGWATFHADDVVFRNNTFGVSYTASGAQQLRAEGIIFAGEGESPHARFFNNIFYVDQIVGNDYDASIAAFGGSFKNVISNSNLLLSPFSTANLAKRGYLYWRAQLDGDVNPDYAWEEVTPQTGQESRSLLVCTSGCSSANASVQARIYNDPNAKNYFLKPNVNDGAVSNYTPTQYNRGINAGYHEECPAEDFYGHPRNDGYCDIGAVEYQGPCIPTTCIAQGKNCGTIQDGCGGILDCGSCTAPQTCGGGGANLCGLGTCIPKTCGQPGICGDVSDGCSRLLNCADCYGQLDPDLDTGASGVTVSGGCHGGTPAGVLAALWFWICRRRKLALR